MSLQDFAKMVTVKETTDMFSAGAIHVTFEMGELLKFPEPKYKEDTTKRCINLLYRRLQEIVKGSSDTRLTATEIQMTRQMHRKSPATYFAGIDYAAEPYASMGRYEPRDRSEPSLSSISSKSILDAPII